MGHGAFEDRTPNALRVEVSPLFVKNANGWRTGRIEPIESLGFPGLKIETWGTQYVWVIGEG
jgi:hypothetical protein